MLFQKNTVFFLLSSFLALFFIACGDNATQHLECITSADCSGELICLDNQCVEENEIPEQDAIEDSQPDKDTPIIIVPDEDDDINDNGNTTDDDITNDDTVDVDEIVSDDDSVVDEDFTPDTVQDRDAVIDETVDSDIVLDETQDEDLFVQICGNGIVEGDEECDNPDGNIGGYDGCKADCTRDDYCGDGSVNKPDEKCDSGEHNGEYNYCNDTCSGAAERCGDDIINGSEFCDDGPLNGHYNYCGSFCLKLSVRCGDGVLQAEYNEQCDEGVANGAGTCEYGSTEACTVCSADCKNEAGTPVYCGDDAINGSEVCDDGAANGSYDHCADDCLGIGPHCGDGYVNGPELCDDGNAVEDDYCDHTCELIGECGDGIIQSNEDCDEGKFCDNDNSIECTDNAALCGAGNCITIQKSGCNPSCSTDMEPPTVVSVDPANGDHDIMISTIIVIFSEDMKYADAKITLLKEGDSTPVEYSPVEHHNQNSFTYAVTFDFTSDFSYTATVLATAKDTGGNELGTPYEWHFRVDDNECDTLNGSCAQHCTNSAGGYDCSCDSGYRLAADGLACDDIDECSEGLDNCDDTNGNCTNSEPGFSCSCKSGYRLQADDHSCVDIDECFEKTDNCNESHGSCTDKDGGFDCSCNAYYSGDGVSCSYCNTSTQCDADCHTCPGEQSCKTNVNGTTHCVECVTDGDCSSGFHCDADKCVDTDECLTDNGGCDEHASCTNNTGASPTCSCDNYYTGSGTSCTYCNSDFQCGSGCVACAGDTLVCKDNGSTTQCVECITDAICGSGYHCSANSCVDTNECLIDNGGCDSNATCHNGVGDFSCSCDTYYNGDGFTCTYCDSDTMCGSGCAACAASTPKCKDNGATTECVECLSDDDCSGSDICNTAVNACISACPSGWDDQYGRCFYFSSGERTYDNAKSYCESYTGGHLVTIENSSVDSYVADNTSEMTWIGLDGRTTAYKVAVSGAPGYTTPKLTGVFGGRYSGNNTDSTLFRHAEIYKIIPSKTADYDITVTPTDGWDPQIRVFLEATEDSLGASAVAHAWANGAGVSEQLTVNLTGGTTYYIATTHCNGCVAGSYDMFINYSGVADANYQAYGWPSGVNYDYENWYGTNPNGSSDYCAFMYGGDEWDDLPCTELHYFVCDKSY